MTSSHWLKQRREALGITQEQLAERLTTAGMTITKAAISKWEVGKASLPLQTPENRHLIADVLELSIPELLAFDGYEINTEWSYDARLVATLFEMLPADDREAILVMVNHLKTKQDKIHPSKSSSTQNITSTKNKSASA